MDVTVRASETSDAEESAALQVATWGETGAHPRRLHARYVGARPGTGARQSALAGVRGAG